MSPEGAEYEFLKKKKKKTPERKADHQFIFCDKPLLR
jgi:hypothetical protein